MKVARVSLVDKKEQVMMDQYVMPRYDVLDFNTAFSGVEPKHLENAISLEAHPIHQREDHSGRPLPSNGPRRTSHSPPYHHRHHGAFLQWPEHSEIRICSYHDRAQTQPDTSLKYIPYCFEEPESSDGCMTHDCHTTPLENGEADYRSRKVYGIETELVYTLNGMEVARVSLVDMKGRVIMNQYVMPRYEVLDFNTAFSGVEPEHPENAISWEAAHTQFSQYNNENTILAGHSFEMDLKGLRIPHRTIIDTAVLFSNGLDTRNSAFPPRNLLFMPWSPSFWEETFKAVRRSIYRHSYH